MLASGFCGNQNNNRGETSAKRRTKDDGTQQKMRQESINKGRNELDNLIINERMADKGFSAHCWPWPLVELPKNPQNSLFTHSLSDAASARSCSGSKDLFPSLSLPRTTTELTS